MSAKVLTLTTCLQSITVGIKSLLNVVSITDALINVNAAQSKLVLLENFNENYSKCLRLLVKLQLPVRSYYCKRKLLLVVEVKTAQRLRRKIASTKVTTVSTKLMLLKELMLLVKKLLLLR
ncbi:hypothetical protein Tco_0982874 [Tanacetum coccineum]